MRNDGCSNCTGTLLSRLSNNVCGLTLILVVTGCCLSNGNSLFWRVGRRNSPSAYLRRLRLSAHADPVRSTRNESAETSGVNETAN